MPEGPLPAEPFPAELEGMQEIALPQPVSRTPQTIGWGVVFATLLLVAALVAWRSWQRYQRNAYRRLALARLDDVDLRSLPALVKRTALDAYAREDVADLSGDAWLAFLDHSYGGTGFTTGPGRALPVLAYGDASSISDGQAKALTSLVRTWIKRHRV